jgi:hypothetical protein
METNEAKKLEKILNDNFYTFCFLLELWSFVVKPVDELIDAERKPNDPQILLKFETVSQTLAKLFRRDFFLIALQRFLESFYFVNFHFENSLAPPRSR